MAQATKLFDLSAPVAALAAKPIAIKAPSLEPVPAPAEGPRKLVRPRLPENMARAVEAPRRLRGAAPLIRHEGRSPLQRSAHLAASHAEALYFQKQMQTQTPIVFVLEDGEHLEGVVEWFDRDSIKVRNTTRVLLFKRSIKYLYKAGGDIHG